MAGVGLVVVIVVVALRWSNSGGDASPPSVGFLEPKFGGGPHFFSADGKILIVVSRANDINLAANPKISETELSVWDIADKKQLRSIISPNYISAISLTKNGGLLAVSLGGPVRSAGGQAIDGKPREIRLFSFPDLKEKGEIASERYINSMAFSPDGKLLATASKSDTFPEPAEVRVWDAVNFKLKYTIKDFEIFETTVQFSPDSKTLAMGDSHLRNSKLAAADPFRDSAEIRIHESEKGELVKRFRLGRRNHPLGGLHCTPDGKKLIVDWDFFLALEVATGEETKIGGDRSLTGMTTRNSILSADGKWLLASSNFARGNRPQRDPRVICWDLETRKIQFDWEPKLPIGEKYLGSIAISPDKKTLAVGGDKIYLYDLAEK